MIRVVLFCFLPFWVQAQAMQPGVYKDLKSTKPIILGKGEYTFINLKMKDLGSGVWLDGRQAKEIILKNCHFEGTGSGTAVLSSGDLQVSHCHFENMGTAILQQSPGGKVRKVSIVSNVFKDNMTSIYLKKQTENEICLSMKYAPIPGQSPSNLLSVRRALRNSPDRGDTRFENCYFGIINRYNITAAEGFINNITSCTITSNPLTMPIPYIKRGPEKYKQFITQVGIQLLGNSNYPVSSLAGSGQPDLYHFKNNRITNCAVGMIINTNNEATASRYISVQNCVFHGIALGLRAGKGVGEITGCTFELPDDITGYYNLTFGSSNPSSVPTESIGLQTFNTAVNANRNHFRIGSEIHRPIASESVGRTGIESQVRGGETHAVSITGNRFIDMGTSIRLAKIYGEETDPATFDFTLRCNNFETAEIPTGQTRIGLHLGDGVKLNGPIGNSGLNNSPTPNGNVWPVDPINSTTTWPVPDPNPSGVAILAGWVSPANWTSLQNDNTAPAAILEYWAFDNEFVRSNTSPNTMISLRLPPANQVMVYPEGTPEPTTPGIDFVELCSADLPHVFPLPLRPALPKADETTATLAGIGKQTGQVVLGDAIPNPAGISTRIPVFIPAAHSGSVWLQVFDLTGRAVRWQTEVTQTGSQWVEISLKDFPAGVYGYSLVDKGKTVGNRKLVVIR